MNIVTKAQVKDRLSALMTETHPDLFRGGSDATEVNGIIVELELGDCTDEILFGSYRAPKTKIHSYGCVTFYGQCNLSAQELQALAKVFDIAVENVLSGRELVAA